MRHYDIRKNIEKIVFRALSNGAIRILLRCSGAEIYRFLMLHFKRIILYNSTVRRMNNLPFLLSSRNDSVAL